VGKGGELDSGKRKEEEKGIRRALAGGCETLGAGGGLTGNGPCHLLGPELEGRTKIRATGSHWPQADLPDRLLWWISVRDSPSPWVWLESAFLFSLFVRAREPSSHSGVKNHSHLIPTLLLTPPPAPPCRTQVAPALPAQP
jgi:hypothetical protein